MLYRKQRILLTAYRSLKLGGIYGRFSNRAVVFYEGAEKVLASADRPLPDVVGQPHRVHVRLSRRTIHLHALLNRKQ